MHIEIGSTVAIKDDSILLPYSVANEYKKHGISSVFKWQAECLSLPGVLDGRRNLVYSAPTSAGKTLVAEFLILKHLLEFHTKAIVILPFVSVSSEKKFYFQSLFTNLGTRVGGFFGGQSPQGGLAVVDVAVCTIEKANSLINRLIEENRLNELGIVVVDELHLIGDPHRGYLLELLLTKLVVHSRRCRHNSLPQSASSECVNNGGGNLQLIGMSATLPNLHSIASWLDAHLYSTNFRPVGLNELLLVTNGASSSSNNSTSLVTDVPDDKDHKGAREPSWCGRIRSGYLDCMIQLNQIDNCLFNSCSSINDQHPSNTKALCSSLPQDDEDGVINLCLTSIATSNGQGVLVFCPTKQWCERLADKLARALFNLTKDHLSNQAKTNQNDANAQQPQTDPADSSQDEVKRLFASLLDRVSLLGCVNQLKACPSDLDPCLGRVLGYAVAYHHAGLTVEEREIIEAGFRRGAIKILVATSTLSSGVNLPARRVIIRTPLFHNGLIDYLTYKQMAGRAGRQGIDTFGESILLCKSREFARVRSLLTSGMPPIKSCLMTHSGQSPETSMKRALLEVIANGFIETIGEARIYLASTLLGTELAATSTTSSQSQSQRRRSQRLQSSPKTQSSSTLCSRLLDACLEALVEAQLIYPPSSSRDGQKLEQSEKETSDDNQSGEANDDDLVLRPTPLGRAVLASCLGPSQGLVVFDELSKARQSLALDTDLHLVYILTPIYLDVGTGNLDWFAYLDLLQSLSSAERRVASLVGIDEAFVLRCASGGGTMNKASNNSKLALHKRFYTALALFQLVTGQLTLSQLATRLGGGASGTGASRGLLQSLQHQAANYAGMVSTFCHRLGWSYLERLVVNFQSRLLHGIPDQLVELIRLEPLVNAQRARALYEAGFTSLSHLATCHQPLEVTRVLQRARPYEQSDSNQPSRTIPLDDGSFVNDYEAGHLIVERARQLVKSDLSCLYGANVAVIIDDNQDNAVTSPSANQPPGSIIKRTVEGPVEMSPTNDENACQLPKLEQLLPSPTLEKSTVSVATGQLNSPRTETRRTSQPATTPIKQSPSLFVPLLPPVANTSHNLLPQQFDTDPLPIKSQLAASTASSTGLTVETTNLVNSPVPEPRRASHSSLFNSPTTPVKQLSTKSSTEPFATVHQAAHSSSLSQQFDTDTLPTTSQLISPTAGLVVATTNQSIVNSSPSERPVSLFKSPTTPSEPVSTLSLTEPIVDQAFHGSSLSQQFDIDPLPLTSQLVAASTTGPLVAVTMTSQSIANSSEHRRASNSLLFKSPTTSSKHVSTLKSTEPIAFDQVLHGSSLSQQFDTDPLLLTSQLVAALGQTDPTPANSMLQTSAQSIEDEKEVNASSSLLFTSSLIDAALCSSFTQQQHDHNSISAPSPASSRRESAVANSAIKLDDGGVVLNRVQLTSPPTASSESDVETRKRRLNGSAADMFTSSSDEEDGSSTDDGTSGNVLSTHNPEDANVNTRPSANYPLTRDVSPSPQHHDSSDALFEIVDVCRSKDLVASFLTDLAKSLASFVDRRKIGLQLAWVRSTSSPGPLCWLSGPAGGQGRGAAPSCSSSSSSDLLTLTGLALTLGWIPNTTFWFNLGTQVDSFPSFDSRLQAVRDVIRILYSSSTSSASSYQLVIWSVKWFCRVAHELLSNRNQPPPVNSLLVDPSLLAWLNQPDAGCPLTLEATYSAASDRSSSRSQLLMRWAKAQSGLHLLEPPTQFSDWSKIPLLADDDDDITSRELTSADHLPPIHILAACFQSQLLALTPGSGGLDSCLVDRELSCHVLLASIERFGFDVDLTLLNSHHSALIEARRHLELTCHRLVGHSFRLDSPKEIGKVLYHDLHLPRLGPDQINLMTGSRSKLSSLPSTRKRRLVVNSSTSTGHLARLTTNLHLVNLTSLHPLPSLLIEWRHVNGLLTKSLDTLVASCIRSSSSDSVRLAPNYDAFTATGRLISCAPNIQVVPKLVEIDFQRLHKRPPSQHQQTDGPSRLDWPDEIKACLAKFLPSSSLLLRPRQAFRVNKQRDVCLISADYRQLELRLMAHLSQDRTLLDALQITTTKHDDQQDVFCKLAVHWLKLGTGNSSSRAVKVTDEQRQLTKKLFYAVAYGMGPSSLAEQLNVGHDEAQSHINSFLATFSGVRSFIASTLESARREGLIRTIGGRVRHLPVLLQQTTTSDDSAPSNAAKRQRLDKNESIRGRLLVAKAERQAVNSIIQGSAADVAKQAMLNVDARLLCGGDSQQLKSYCRLVLHEHDELIYEIHPLDAVDRYCRLIAMEMERVSEQFNLSIPLPVKLQTGPSWGELDERDGG